VPKYPMVRGFPACCARAASGHAAAIPINVRRSMAAPCVQDYARFGFQFKPSKQERMSGEMGKQCGKCALQKSWVIPCCGWVRSVELVPFATFPLCPHQQDVGADIVEPPVSATSRYKPSYSITSSCGYDSQSSAANEKAGVVSLEPGDIRDGGEGVRLKKPERRR
jgi:hypothetical protein